MLVRMAAIVFIFVCTSVAWAILGTTVTTRTATQDNNLKSAVGQLWGTPQHQLAPQLHYETVAEHKVSGVENGKLTTVVNREVLKHPLLLDGSDLNVNLQLEHRQKGLLWYSTYRVQFNGKYRVTNYTDAERDLVFTFALPTKESVYDNFRLAVGAREVGNLQFNAGAVQETVKLKPGQSETVEVAYGTQGLDDWWYDFGADVNQVKNFSLVMRTDFGEIDFPPSSISPTQKVATGNGWELRWQYASLLSGVKIGMVMPHKLNPGPWVSDVSFSAPVSLFLFFFVLFLLTTVKKVKLHPMNYFFIGTAFFSFHLLLAYLVDHISIHAAFLLCSLVSIFLTVSYLRLVVGNRFAFVEAGVLQFVYLVLFSYTFFFERYTGLAITILCILTLFIVMQFTGRVDWDTLFRKGESPTIAPAETTV